MTSVGNRKAQRVAGPDLMQGAADRSRDAQPSALPTVASAESVLMQTFQEAEEQSCVLVYFGAGGRCLFSHPIH